MTSAVDADRVLQRALVLGYFDARPLLENYQRVYAGAEFCSWALPAPAQLLQARQLAREFNLPFTLMTPVLREETLAELETLFAQLADAWGERDEVLISDLGTLEVARRQLPRARLVLGRALSGQKRGPRIEDLSLSAEALHYFQQGSWYTQAAVELLAEQNIQRVELDNLLQGIAPLPSPLQGSLHLPWLLVTSSRNCPYHRDKKARRCRQGCGEALRLSTDQTRHPLLQAGNSQFIEHRQLPDNLTALRIDRVVEHLELPR
ncbi:MAG: hypothetical protein GW861_12485 [Deltaproteobacteria bacterium]|nr:hypothetical protein [Deltaproteobacteria bacterium]